jgi:hypothetical protein
MDAAAFQEAVLTLRSADCRDFLGEAEEQQQSATSSSTTTRIMTPSTSSPHAASTTTTTAAARCRPWSEADFFGRLRSFTPQTWFGKPLAAAPPRCAAHGWVNEGTDVLRCEG